MVGRTRPSKSIDLASIFALKGWTDKSIAVLWSASLIALISLLSINFYIKEPDRAVDTPCMLLGLFSFLTVIYGEARGEYAMRGGRPLLRIERPEKFREQSNLIIVVGMFMAIAGVYFETYGLYMRVKFGQF